MKAIVFFTLTLLQVIVLITGFLITVINTVKGFTNDDAKAKKKAFKYFMLSITVVFVIGVIDFIVAFYFNA